MTLVNVRPKILKQYYEAAYGQQTPRSDAYQGTTFDEYFQLLSITEPGISQRCAAEKSSRPEFRKLAKGFPPDPEGEQPLLPHFVQLERRAAVDLEKAEIEPNVENLVLDRLKSVSGLAGLRRLKRLRALTLVLCKIVDEAALSPPRALELLTLLSCPPQSMELVLTSTTAREITLRSDEAQPLGLAPLRQHQNLADLDVDAGGLRHLRALEPLPLRRLHLSGVIAGQELQNVLRSLATTLQDLGLKSAGPFGPSILPEELPALQRLEVAAYEEFRAEWIQWAVAHPEVSCWFPVYEPPRKSGGRVLAEIYRGIDVLRFQKGRKVCFGIAANLVDEVLDTDELSNGDLEELLRPLAKKAAKQIQWDSEADTLGMQADDLKTCKWLIDTVHDLHDRGLPKRRK